MIRERGGKLRGISTKWRKRKEEKEDTRGKSGRRRRS
jgi:hypothetical protein